MYNLKKKKKIGVPLPLRSKSPFVSNANTLTNMCCTQHTQLMAFDSPLNYVSSIFFLVRIVLAKLYWICLFDVFNAFSSH